MSYSSCSQFPNLNTLITRDVFATIASEAVCETANINLAVLYQAALSVFDEKLDTIGSGMVAVGGNGCVDMASSSRRRRCN